jgi:hypothetical protein
MAPEIRNRDEITKGGNKTRVFLEHANEGYSSRAGEDEFKRERMFNAQTLRVYETSSGDVIKAEPLCALITSCRRGMNVILGSRELDWSGS